MAKELIHTDSRFFGHKLSIPVDGTVQLGPKGEVTVSEQAAKILLTIPHWVDPKALPKKAGEPENLSKPKKQSKLVTEEISEESVAFGVDLDQLDGLEIAQLLEIADAADLKVPPPFKTNKKSLVTYLRNQLKKKLTPQ